MRRWSFQNDKSQGTVPGPVREKFDIMIIMVSLAKGNVKGRTGTPLSEMLGYSESDIKRMHIIALF